MKPLVSADTLFVTASMTQPAMPAAEVARSHRAQGFFKPACHYFIEPNGRIAYGRPTTEPGCLAGTALNGRSIQVVLIGGVDESLRPTDTFTAAQRMALARLHPELPRVIDKQSPIKEL